MTPLRIRSLYLKAVIPIVALVLTAMAGVSYLAMRAMGEGVRLVASQRAQYGLAYVRNSVEDVEHTMRVDHGVRLQGVIERLGRNPDMDAIRILSVAGKILYSSKPAEVGQMLPAHVPKLPTSVTRENAAPIVEERPGLVHTVGPIFNRRRCAVCHDGAKAILAFVDIDISLSRQSAGMRAWGSMAIVAGVLQFAFVGIGVALVLGLVVVRPIRRLSQSMSQVQHGNLVVVSAAPGTSELDSLVKGFNDMVGRLRRARQIEDEAQLSHMVRVEQLATLGEMAASLAHELRNPLSGVKAAIDVLASEETAEEPRRILRHVSEELVRVDGVVRQLLNFAKPRAPVLAPVDLHALLNDAVMLSRPKAAAQGAVLDVQLPPTPLEVLADADMVQQVVVNLLLNALNAVEGVPGAQVVISTGARDGRPACSVRDNGAGVPAGRADMIFRPFMTTKPRGTGLGLATSRRLVELQGGRIWLENPGEAGACFTFTLPVLTDHAVAGI
jgi:two-component system NtrC family sensor kinase